MEKFFLPLRLELSRCRTFKMKRDRTKHCTTSAMSSKKGFILILKQLFIGRSSIDIYMGVFLGEMCSDRYKNHGCRQEIPEGTSSAIFDVRTIAKCCEFKRCTSTQLMLRELRKFLCYDKHGCFLLGKYVRTAAKTMVVDRKKTEGTTSARFNVRTAAKCCELKRCADQVRSRTDNKDEVLEGTFIT